MSGRAQVRPHLIPQVEHVRGEPDMCSTPAAAGAKIFSAFGLGGFVSSSRIVQKDA